MSTPNTQSPHVEGGTSSGFKPAAPLPHAQRLGLLPLLATVWRNPLEAWAQPHFKEWIVVERMLPGEFVLLNEPSAIRRVLVDNVDNYHKDTLQKRVMGAAFSDGLLAAEDVAWHEQRRVAAPMFAHRAVAAVSARMVSGIEDIIFRWRRFQPGAVVDVAAEMSNLALDVLVRTIFTDGIGGSHELFMKNMRLYFDSFGRIDALDIMGLPNFLPRSGKRRARSAQEFFDSAVDKLLEQRRQQLTTDPDGAPFDLTTLLLKAQDPVDGVGLSEAAIRSNLITFIAAGHETTANVITWALYLLSNFPDWSRQVADEFSQVGLDDASRLVLTRAVVDEAIRLYPPIVAISRQALGEDVLAGHQVGKGTMVVVSPYVLHRHRLLWDRPDHFDPTRFLASAKGRIPRFSYLPFGIGPRTCIGAAFALQEATLALAALVGHFDFQIEDGHRVWPLQRVTLRPEGGLPMRVTVKPGT